MAKSLGRIGEHLDVEDLERTDVNGRGMFRCNSCRTYTSQAEHFNEASVPCVSDCANCNALRMSSSSAPAVPRGGNCNTILYECPCDGRRWWQTNGYFHLWQQVTSPEEWGILHREGYGNPHAHDQDSVW